MPSTDADVINYIPRRAALPDKPRKVSVSITRTAEGLWHTSMPVEDLDYLIALEFERQRQLADIARRDLFLEGGVGQMKRPSLKKKKL